MVQRLADKSLDDLTELMEASATGSPNANAVMAEIQRRMMVSQIEAADAAKETARYTRRSAHYILLSVIVLAISAVIAALR